MGEVVQFPVSQFVEDYDPRKNGQPIDWVCGDDRPAINLGLYRQTLGGDQGSGNDWAVAIDLARQDHGDFSLMTAATKQSQEATPSHVLAGIGAKIAIAHGIKLMNHNGCAGEQSLLDVVDVIVNEDDEVYKRALKFDPLLSSNLFEKIQDAHRRPRVANPAVAVASIDNGTYWNGMHFPGVPRVPLKDINHVAGDVIADHRHGVAFNAAAALANGTPAYHVSMGDMHELHRAFNSFIPIKYQYFIGAAAVRSAATTMLLPVPAGQTILRIHELQAA